MYKSTQRLSPLLLIQVKVTLGNGKSIFENKLEELSYLYPNQYKWLQAIS